MTDSFDYRLNPNDRKYGYLKVPSKHANNMPNKSGYITLKIGKIKKKVNYNSKISRITGLKVLYQEHGINAKDWLELQKKAKNEYELINLGSDFVDPSKLNSTIKGDIVEDGIKDLILLHGGGLLNVYKPVSDIEGIDMIVVKKKHFYPIFLQIKGRYSQKVWEISSKNFTPHENYYIVTASFDPRLNGMGEYILLIPSIVLGHKRKLKNRELRQVSSSLKDSSKGKWAKYKYKKEDLAAELIKRFKEMKQNSP